MRFSTIQPAKLPEFRVQARNGVEVVALGRLVIRLADVQVLGGRLGLVTCGKHKRPVIIHVSDPAAFFTPLDRYNERWHELNANPHWLFFGEQFTKREDILDQLHRTIARHPETTFVNTHFGNNAEDMAAVAEKLDKYPNMYVDIDARISELGRQPYTARRFFLKYQDRILFGTDAVPRPAGDQYPQQVFKDEMFQIYYRFLETEDEYFDYAPAKVPPQGPYLIKGYPGMKADPAFCRPPGIVMLDTASRK